ncbi:MAG: DUF5668 domain-containing protein [Paludibacter sp.]|nr:DUF5668 domain-containing protein [Paludibacter sp.]
MAAKKDNRLAWGISLLVFGLLFLIKQFHIIPPEFSSIVFDFRNFPFLLGIIFLLIHSNKNIGLILILAGVLFRLSDIIHYTRHISDYIWPVLLIVAGAFVIFSRKIGK